MRVTRPVIPFGKPSLRAGNRQCKAAHRTINACLLPVDDPAVVAQLEPGAAKLAPLCPRFVGRGQRPRTAACLAPWARVQPAQPYAVHVAYAPIRSSRSMWV